MNVAIIGASLGGLFAAYHLAREGVEVEVYERASVLGSSSRTLIVTDKLNEILGFVPEEAIVNRIRKFEIFSRSKSVRIELSRPDLVIERERLIKLLARLAEEAGARIHLGYQFEGFFRAGKKMVLNLRDLKTGKTFSLLSDILVGADGASSAVAKAISYDGHFPTALLQARVAFSGEGTSDTCQVWFDPDYTKYFFWSIPECAKFSTVGLIADDDRQARVGLEAFLKERGLKPLEFQEAKVPLYRWSGLRGGESRRRGVFLVGDAAAQVKVTTVGGVVTGLYGAKMLARAILNGEDYQRQIRGLKLELGLHLLIRTILNRFINEDYDELLERVNGRLKGVFETWTRDELRSFFLNLILTEPRLIQLGLKTILRSIIHRISF
jgi:flavin-dependent dehydrogenase